MNHEEYVYNEYYCPMLMEWRSKDRYKPRKLSEEQKFRDKEMKIIFKQHLSDIEVNGLDIAAKKLNKNIELLNIKVKLWKDRQNEQI